MARTIQIKYLTDTIDLLDLSGYQLQLAGGVPGAPNYVAVWNPSAFAEGGPMSAVSLGNVVEEYVVNLTAASHDSIATKIQALIRMATRTRQYSLTNWQQDPVYLKTQLTNESNPRYALIHKIDIKFDKPFYDPPMDPGNRVNDITVTITREPYWREYAPGDGPADSLAIGSKDRAASGASDCRRYVVNSGGNPAISDIYNYDASATAFSSNLCYTYPFTYFEVSGSTPAVGDMIYFGGYYAFHLLQLHITTAAVASGVTLAYEYWDGAAWSAIATYPPNFLYLFESTGERTLPFLGATDWAATSVNSQNRFWIRLRITALTTWTTSPVQSDAHPVNSVTSNYISLANTLIDGDAPALARFRMTSGTRDEAIISRVYVGAKSRGLSNFVSRLSPVSGVNPTGWSETYGTDSALAYDERAGFQGQIVHCNFSTTLTEDVRATIVLTDADKIPDWEGEYHVFLLCEQTGGSAGDVQVRFDFQYVNAEYESSWRSLQEVDDGPEVVSMGRMTLFPIGFQGSENAYADGSTVGLEFMISAKSAASGADLNMFEFVFIPVDEWASAFATDQDLFWTGWNRYGTLMVDAGIWRKSSYILFEGNDEEMVQWQWETRGAFPIIEPDKAFRYYFLFADDKIADSSLGTGIEIKVVQRWQVLMGTG